MGSRKARYSARLQMASCRPPVATEITQEQVKIISWSPAGDHVNITNKSYVCSDYQKTFWLLKSMTLPNQNILFSYSWLTQKGCWQPKNNFSARLAPQKVAGNQNKVFSSQLAPKNGAGDQKGFSSLLATKTIVMQSLVQQWSESMCIFLRLVIILILNAIWFYSKNPWPLRNHTFPNSVGLVGQEPTWPLAS